MKPRRTPTVLEKLAKIDVVSWEWNERAAAVGSEPGTRSIGVVSQQLATVFPELTVERDGYLGVDYGGLAAVVLAGLQELSVRVAALEGKSKRKRPTRGRVKRRVSRRVNRRG